MAQKTQGNSGRRKEQKVKEEIHGVKKLTWNGKYSMLLFKCQNSKKKFRGKLWISIVRI